METRVAAIRKRSEDERVVLSGPKLLVQAFEQKDADIAWLLAEVEAKDAVIAVLRKRVAMYEQVKS